MTRFPRLLYSAVQVKPQSGKSGTSASTWRVSFTTTKMASRLCGRVGQERVLGRTHLMYDVHTLKGRGWVMTEPTNLYDEESFPALDYTHSFHLGLRARIATKPS